MQTSVLVENKAKYNFVADNPSKVFEMILF